MVRSFFTDTLVQFFIAAAAIFAVYSWVTASAQNPVVLSAEVRTALIDNFEGITGKPASQSDIAKLERDYIMDELLFREAIDRGMHLSDSQTKTHLTNALRRSFAGEPPRPSQEDLVNFYAENIEDYRGEPTISFRQVFFSDTLKDPAATLASLNKGTVVQGSPYWMGNDFPDYGESMVRGVFGTQFLSALQDLPMNRWAGPVETERGVHFIYKSAAKEGTLVPFAQIRDQIEQDYWAMQTRQNLDLAVAKLKEKYDVVIAETP